MSISKIKITSTIIIIICIAIELCLGISMSSSGTEFIIKSGNQLTIKSIYDNTDIFIHINEDSFPDYTLNLDKTDNEILINTEWKLKSGSRIISTKPIMIRELSKKIEFTGKGVIQKIYCVLPDIISYKKEYLLEKGMHTIISPTENNISIYNLKEYILYELSSELDNQKKDFSLKKNIPLQILIDEDTIIKSEKPLISYNEYCIDPISSYEFYLVFGEHNLFPTKENQTFFIDYNSDGFYDENITTEKESKVTINSTNGARIYSDKKFFLKTNIFVEDNFVKFKFSFNGITEKIREYFVGLFDEQLEEYHVRITKIGPLIYNQTYIKKNQKKSDFLKKILLPEKSIGYEITDLFKSRSYHSFSGEVIVPQISSVEYISDAVNKITIIRVFNPKYFDSYNNITMIFYCRYDSIDCLIDANKYSIDTDEKIEQLNIKKLNNFIEENNDNNNIITLDKLTNNTYIEIKGQDIIRYSIIVYEDKQ